MRQVELRASVDSARDAPDQEVELMQTLVYDPKPGSPKAVAAGCTCPRADNAHGTGVGAPPRFFISGECPVHAVREREPDDWATRTAVAYVSDLRPAPADVDVAVARLATVLRAIACDCFMASPIVRPEFVEPTPRAGSEGRTTDR